MLTTVTAAADPAADRHPLHVRSLVDRDEYGPITGRPGGLLTAPAATLALEARDELGRPALCWVPDSDLL